MKPSGKSRTPRQGGTLERTRCDLPTTPRSSRSEARPPPASPPGEVTVFQPHFAPVSPPATRSAQRPVLHRLAERHFRTHAQQGLLLAVALATLGYTGWHVLRPVPKANAPRGVVAISSPSSVALARPAVEEAKGVTPDDATLVDLETRAARSVLAGRREDAAALYEKLSAVASHPAAYATAAKVLHQQSRTDLGTTP